MKAVEKGDIHYQELIARMEKWIAVLDASQGATHLPAADLYWYIEKLQEVKLLLEGISIRNRSDLKDPLEELCSIILCKLAHDQVDHQQRKSA